MGYFDNAKCYEYVFNDNEAERHFNPSSMAANRTCAGAKEWSGNYLNWAATQTIDPFRLALTGGYRVRDTATETWLEKARHDRDALYPDRSEEHTSELQSLMRISYAVFCLKKKKNTT